MSFLKKLFRFFQKSSKKKLDINKILKNTKPFSPSELAHFKFQDDMYLRSVEQENKK